MVRTPVRAVLGPTNTGKTHLAIERLCAHSSGIMGFPLRLLAREVYDRVCAIKGPAEVGLLTGEERIMPPGARWILCTAESMPVDREAAFVALDEAQLGVDPERGHVFTHRLLNARGRDETMILGSASLRSALQALLPGAEITGRERFSKLSHVPPRKLKHLPKRSAIIAFSADDVYAIAELVRRTCGGAAVVMGSLSPRTRNAQVEMFQAGEVDYLVATDAIGMGLNMDIAHVAFAGLEKFDGKRKRRLLPNEIAQIAGRAGRHHRDGTFGVLAGSDAAAFAEEEIDRVENHRFKPLSHLNWRNADLDFSSLESLIQSLETPPVRSDWLRAAPAADDYLVAKMLADDPEMRLLASRSKAAIRRLWQACGLPDFRKAGPDVHAQLVKRLYRYLGTGGHLPQQMIANEIARLDTIQGDIDTIAGRIAAVRTWAYVAHRSDWLQDPAHWAERAAAVEARLSDALHAALTQRFVDRRTTVLLRQIALDPTARAVDIVDDGTVIVDGETAGRIDGFRFVPMPGASFRNQQRLAAIVERKVAEEVAQRARKLAQAPDHAFGLVAEPGRAVKVSAHGRDLAAVKRGRGLLEPRIELDADLAALPHVERTALSQRLTAWLRGQVARHLAPLQRMASTAAHRETPATTRALLAAMVEAGGWLPRRSAAEMLPGQDAKARKLLHQLGLAIGSLACFHPSILRPEATRWRLALLAVRASQPMPPVPMAGLGLLDAPSPRLAQSARDAGYWAFGQQMLRIDLVEKIARAVHDQREGFHPFSPDRSLATSLGVGDRTFDQILSALGFVRRGSADAGLWRWQGLKRQRERPGRQPHGPFAGLAQHVRRPAH